MDKSDKYYIFCINIVDIVKSPENLEQFNQVILIMRGNQLVMTTELRTFHFDLRTDVDINLKHEIYFTIKHNELLA